MIRRAPHRRRYVQVDNRAVEDKRLSLRAKGLLVYLLSRPDNWRAQPAQVAQTTSDSVGMVRSCLQELKRFGYARLERIGIGKGKFGGSEWVIDELPFADELPLAVSASELQENRDSENTKLGFAESRETGDLISTEKKNKTDASFDFADATLQAEWEAYQEHRRQKRQVMTVIARGRAVRQLSLMGVPRAIAALRHTIAQGWTGIYEPRAAQQQGGSFDFSRMDVGALQRLRVKLKNSVNWKKGDEETERVKPKLLAIKEELIKRGKSGLYYTSTY